MKKGRRKILQASLSLLPGVTPLMSTVEARTPGLTISTKSTPDFIVKPYLQFGNPAEITAGNSLVLMWHTEDLEGQWAVDLRTSEAAPWFPAAKVSARDIAVPTIQAHRVFQALMTRLIPGSEFEYRVSKNGREVFKSRGKAPKLRHQDCRIAVLLDVGINSPGQKAVANQIHHAQPDLVVIPGDIAYSAGRISEYRTNFYPVYNADEASPTSGAPLMRSIPFIAGLGQHDVQEQYALEEMPDGFAYFINWSMPWNGPDLRVGDQNVIPLRGGFEKRKALLNAIQPNYPRMATYSLPFGNTQWTILDSNDHVDWKDSRMRSWLSENLKQAPDGVWKFVGCYTPGFQSNRMYFQIQKMRRSADLFEAGGVDIVFQGLIHNYQRTMPLKFRITQKFMGKNAGTYEAMVDGDFILDRKFDGKTHTKPDGVIYLTTGAGGAGLSDEGKTPDPSTWQPYTVKYIADRHSFTLLDIQDRNLTVKQIADNGEEIDRISITK